VEYEPEQFPGLVYRLDEPRVVVLLFGSGKLVCTGARRPEDLELAVGKIRGELQSAGLLPRDPTPGKGESSENPRKPPASRGAPHRPVAGGSDPGGASSSPSPAPA
jgi:hypothetical protein